MARKRIWLVAAVASAAVLVWAYIDGGEEPLRPVAYDVAVPGQRR